MKKCRVEFGTIRFMGIRYKTGAVVMLDDYSFSKLGNQVSLVVETPQLEQSSTGEPPDENSQKRSKEK